MNTSLPSVVCLATPLFLFAPAIHAHPGHADAHAPSVPTPTAVSDGEILGHGSLKFRVHADWGKLDSQKYPIKNCHAMVALKSGDLLALCDDTRHNFLLYAPDNIEAGMDDGVSGRARFGAI